MSAQVTLPGRRWSRLRLAEGPLASGLLPLLAVGLGGLGAGFTLWYVAVSGAAIARERSEVTLVLALALALAAAYAGWTWYGAYFARRAGIAELRSLRWDAATWLGGAVAAAGILAPSSRATPALGIAAGIAIFTLGKLAVAARFTATVRIVLTTFVVTRLPIIVVAELASTFIAQRPGQHVSTSSNAMLAAWGRWDAVHYLAIARNGYYGFDVAFFPLFPALVHVVGRLIGSEIIAGLIVSNVALLFGLLFFYKLVELEFDRRVARNAIFYVSIFPTAIFFSAVYTESLFFALTVASFYYIRRRRWLTAGAIGVFASLTRVEGILLAVPYAIEGVVALRALPDLRSPATYVRFGRFAVGIVGFPLGIGIYMAYLWALVGDPIAFSHAQVHWDRHLAPPWASAIHSYRIVHKSLHAGLYAAFATQGIEIAFTLLMIVVLLAALTRLRPSYLAYMALSILVPMSTSSLMSMPRFALVLFPMFIVLALWGRRPAVNATIVAFSLPLLGLFTVLFADWYWVA